MNRLPEKSAATNPHNALISVIIVNWNGKKWLKRCLDTLLAQTHSNTEIILVDNGSADDSVEYIKTNYPSIKLVLSKTNLGFAGGNNLGYKHAHGEYILLLNNDTYVEPEFLEKFVAAYAEIPRLGSVQCKLVLMYDQKHLDVAGSYWTSSSFLYHYGYGKDATDKRYNQKMPFFSNKGAAMLLRRDIIEELGLFDDDFWCYYEETDLCHRLWVAGYECWYYPNATAYHAMGGTSLLFPNDFIQFHNFKNKLLSFLKNFQLRTLITVIPLYLLVNFLLSILWLIKGKPKHALALYKSIWWNAKHFKATLKKRQHIQSMRLSSDKQIFAQVKRNPSFSYYTKLFNGTLAEYEDRI